MAGLVSRREVEIEWGDCDPAGIVFYPRYFAMFDRSTALLVERAVGVKKIGWRERYGVIGIPMVDTAAKFIIPSKYGDVIEIETRATRLGRTSFDIEHIVRKGDAVAIEARETRVWAGVDPDDPSRIKGVPLPAELVEALRPE
ncbi:MAG: acyl-CoA thioesterase [Rhizobiaceae bacterium]|nr:acyl-CoA thioesterase [Rhizobiaceae bacterium]MCV0406976.1 acyl-CoA thioesterase [Rhizobiaceae bacterium]